MFLYSEGSPTFLVWGKDIFNGKKRNILFRKIGDIAGNLDSDGRYSVAFRVDGKQKRRYCHTIIWEIFNGEVPHGYQVDHIDGDPKNNAISNLRIVTSQGNNRNRGVDSRNSSGVTGVSRTIVNGYSYWTASWVDLNGKRKCKHFSTAKLGEVLAFQEATAFRNAMLVEINKCSEFKYTDRHGKLKED